MSSFLSCFFCMSRSSFSFWRTIARLEGCQHKAGPLIIDTRPVSNWANRHVNDLYVNQAKKDGYRCRSAYKLLQIQEKFNLLEPGLVVMECGCAPGSWSQVVAKLVNANGAYDKYLPGGFLVGCDLLYVEPVHGAVLLPKLDFTDESAKKTILNVVKNRPFDLVLSDMAPNASGVKSLDHLKLLRMAMKVKDFTVEHGRPGTSMVIKVWRDGAVEKFLEMLKEDFHDACLFRPKATYKDSNETYVIARGLLPSKTKKE